jgi:hypothetical protein
VRRGRRSFSVLFRACLGLGDSGCDLDGIEV